MQTIRRRQLRTHGYVVRRAPGVPDRYGNARPGGETRTRYDAWLEPAGGTEDDVDRQSTRQEWRLVLPPEADIRADDLWEDAHGNRYRVDGPPSRLPGRDADEHHVEAQLLVVKGA